ncbi:cyclodeaminase/cyclohydrolase family protein [Rubrobacter aplysinae]|uniref:cyclodeaminase/cyclohydrolase family protein n=1 Tax=Rubrobacter aplysinae TaxID=909625 RepID=UPI00069DE483|nr:cyclodeaminase/cyclohydrolase family protein [Rubrobacter aplysinae]
MSRADSTRPARAPDYQGLSLGEFLDSVASDSPAPGGGGAAAVTASLAAGLVCMSARLSEKHVEDAGELAGRAEGLRGQALPLARADGEAYGRVLAALRLPAGEPGRREALDLAFGEAADVPLRVAELARETAEIAARLAEEGNPNLRGDALTALYLSEAAARSAAELVRLNVEEIHGNGAADARDRRDRATGLYQETAALARRLSGGE